MTRDTVIISFLLTSIVLSGWALLSSKSPVLGSAAPGVAATIASSTAATVPVNASTVLVATSSCVARIISTGQTTAMLTFDDRFAPTGSFGAYQAASTTVVYGAGDYGCGQVKAWTSVTGIITVTDVR